MSRSFHVLYLVVFPDVMSCFLFDGLAYFGVLYSLSPFFTISSRLVIRARVGDNILNCSGLMIALATLDALYWIMYVMVSLMVSMSSSCSVSKWFLNSSWYSIFFGPICSACIVGVILVINVFLDVSAHCGFSPYRWSSCKVLNITMAPKSRNYILTSGSSFDDCETVKMR